jgi:hypothetical protein
VIQKGCDAKRNSHPVSLATPMPDRDRAGAVRSRETDPQSRCSADCRRPSRNEIRRDCMSWKFWRHECRNRHDARGPGSLRPASHDHGTGRRHRRRPLVRILFRRS